MIAPSVSERFEGKDLGLQNEKNNRMMKKKLFYLALFLLVGTAGQAQSKDEKYVAQAVASWHKAMIEADTVALKQLIAEQLSYGHSGGKVETKAMLIEAIGSGKSDFVTMNLSEQTIQIVDKTAIVRHNLAADTNDGGKPASVKLIVLQIWQKQSGKWRLLARQAIKKT